MNPPQPEKKPIAVALVRKPDRPEAPGTDAPAEAAEGAPTVTAPLDAVAPASTAAATLPPSTGERFNRWVTRPAVAVPCILASLALLSWCFLFRLPGRPMIVQARTTPTPVTTDVVSADALTLLQAQSEAALRTSLTNLDQIPPLVADLEQRAKASGFTVEAVTRPPVVPIPQLPSLALHPVSLKLEDNYEREEPAFHRLLDWLRRLPATGVRLEVTSLSLHSLGDGIKSASVELNIPCVQTNTHAQAAPE